MSFAYRSAAFAGYLSLATFFDTIDRMFFTPDALTFNTLGIDLSVFKWLVIGLYIGILIASVFMFYNKRFLGGFVRRVISEGCDSPENAKTLAELGAAKKFLIKWSLSCGYSLRRVITCVGEEIAFNNARMGGNDAESPKKKPVYTVKYKHNFTSDKFYVKDKNLDAANQKFNAKGSGILGIILVAVIGLIVTVLVIKFLPKVFMLLDNALTGIKPSGPDYVS